MVSEKIINVTRKVLRSILYSVCNPAFTDSLELVIDATLSDLGRSLIARGDGSFKITQFAPVDTEIDYTLYNTTSGDSVTAPADILNTPILEPITNESMNEQYELITISDQHVRYLPVMTPSSTTLSISEFSNGTATPSSLTVTPTMSNKATIPAEIVDTLYFVYMDGKFLEPQNYTAYLGQDSAFGMEGYAIDADPNANSYGGRNLTLLVKSKPIDDNTWTVYGTVTAGSRTLTTIVRIKGAVSGLSTNVTVTVNEA